MIPYSHVVAKKTVTQFSHQPVARSIKYMRAFAEAYPDLAIVQQLVARLPWGHNIRIFGDREESGQRDGTHSRPSNMVGAAASSSHQIESSLFDRQGKALTNFSRTLPATQSELAQELMKDP